MERLNVDIQKSIYELQASVKEIDLKRRLYRVLLHGKGLEFEGFRDYSSDDDASMIDWKVSKRTNSVLIRQYREARDLKILFVIDVSDNMVFGSAKKLKCEYAAEICGALANLVVSSGNKFGFIFFNEEIKEVMLPEGGRKQFDIFVDHLSLASNYGGRSNIGNVLDFLINYVDKSISVVFFVSDFLNLDLNLSKKLNSLGNKFETIAIMVKDNLDLNLPDVSGEVILEDPQTGEQLVVDPSLAKKSYENYSMKKDKMILELFRKSSIDVLHLMTNDHFVPKLAEFLKERVNKRIVRWK